MKNKSFNKTLTGKTGKDLLNIMGVKVKHASFDVHVGPTGETETTLYAFWKSLLGHDDFGVKDDFFLAGGNSLKAIQLLSRISAFFLVEVSLTEIFLQPTIAQIAELIGSKKNDHTSVATKIEVAERPQNIPLSFNQERLWFIDQLEGTVQYHLPAIFRLQGKLNTAALSFALTEIVNRHEVLRTNIQQPAGVGCQVIRDKNKWHLSVSDGTTFKKDIAGLRQYIQQWVSEPFDLSKDHMLRAQLVRIGADENILIVTLHHIASDGWSTSMIVNELAELYKSFDEGHNTGLAPLPVQYADFAIWQRQYLHGVVLDKKLDYWKGQLADSTPLQLPIDFSRPAIQSFNGASLDFAIDKNLTEQLNALSNQQGVTLFMTLLAAFKVLLYRYSGQQDISVGTASAGRKQQELESLVGFF
jgi:hypothetical protein